MALSMADVWPDWTSRAACYGRDTSDFFREKRHFAHREMDAMWDALKVCAECPVRRDCLEYTFQGFTVMDDDTGAMVPSQDEFGIFGGTTPKQRREMMDDPDRVDVLLLRLDMAMGGDMSHWMEEISA